MAIYFDLDDIGLTDPDDSNDIGILEDEIAVMRSVQNILFTEKSSRIYQQRQFGSNLEQFLFEPCDNSTAVALFDEIDLALSQEIRISELVIEIIPLPDQNTFEIQIDFRINESERLLEFTTTLEKIR